MWILLKEGRPDEAWDELVNAPDGVSNAIRAHNGFSHLDPHLQTLDAIEHLVFPPQVFMSVGMIVGSQICSICGSEYEDCEHIKGRPYMGRFCTVTLIPAKIDHVSIVEDPANKRCRALKFSVNGGDRNRMTWRVEPSDVDTVQRTEDLRANGIIGTTDSFTEQ